MTDNRHRCRVAMLRGCRLGRRSRAVAEAIELIDRLVEVLTEENKILGRGFPASLIDSTARKNELGEAFEQWVAAVRDAPHRPCARPTTGCARR